MHTFQINALIKFLASSPCLEHHCLHHQKDHAVLYGMFFIQLCKQSSRWKDVLDTKVQEVVIYVYISEVTQVDAACSIFLGRFLWCLSGGQLPGKKYIIFILWCDKLYSYWFAQHEDFVAYIFLFCKRVHLISACPNMCLPIL